jgi:hypothetical protein
MRKESSGMDDMMICQMQCATTTVANDNDCSNVHIAK